MSGILSVPALIRVRDEPDVPFWVWMRLDEAVQTAKWRLACESWRWSRWSVGDGFACESAYWSAVRYVAAWRFAGEFATPGMTLAVRPRQDCVRWARQPG